jgi:hypothetical protein
VPWYRTDEYATDFVLSLSTESGAVRIEELRLEHTFGFENGDAGSLTLENRLRLTLDDLIEWSDSVFLTFQWFRYPEGGVSLPLLPDEIGAEGYWSHQERLSVKLAGPDPEDTGSATELSSIHPLNLTVSHETSLNLPERGILTARAGLGLDLESTADGTRYWRFGLEAALEARIEF